MSATVTVSTSVILAPTQNTAGNYIVYFPNISTNGRLITVRDNDGYASTNHAVVLSTIGGAQFQTGVDTTNSQIYINQPFGFITLNSQTSGRYTILNTFAFPEGSAAAFVNKVTTNNLVTSTLQMIDIGTQSTNTFFTSTGFMYLNSTVMGQVSDAQLQSTVNALGTIGYISTVIIPPLIPALYIATGFTSNQYQNSAKNPIGSIVYSQGNVAEPWFNATAGYSFGFSNGGNDVVVGTPYIVAVGDSYSSSSNQTYIQTSVDGSNWNLATAYLSSPQVRLRVSYANGLYHAVGSNGSNGGVETIMWSRDGASWSNSAYSGAVGAANPFIGTNGYARGIAYGNGRWVTVGVQSNLPIFSLINSTDGSNWNIAANVEAASPTIWDVAFNGTYFIALCGLTSSGGNILRSTDGVNWYDLPTSYSNFKFNVDTTNGGYIAGNNNSTWLLTASNGAPSGQMMWYSLDNGGTWNSNTTFASGKLSRPFWDGAHWWVGYKNYSAPNAQSIYYSENGITWFNNVGSNSFQGGFPQGFASRNAQSNFATILFSTVVGLSSNQNISSLQTNVISTNSITAATMTVSSLFVQVEVISTSFETINSISTITANNLSAGIAYLATAAINSNTVNFISAGTLVNALGSVSTLNARNISTNFLNANGPTTLVNRPTQQLWVAVGDDLGNASIKYSYDGITWSNSSGPGFTSYGRGVAWNGHMWVAVGTDDSPNPTIKHSYDGITWLDSSGSGFTDGLGVAWNGRMWVAVGADASPNATIKYSYDGINWLDSSGPGFTSSGVGVAWNGHMWVAVGADASPNATIKYSYDGINWLDSSGPGFALGGLGVAWNGSMWIGVGRDITPNNTIKYSYDGINWLNSSGSGFTARGVGVAWNGRMWVAVGSDSIANNRIKYSYDGINWLNSSGSGFTARGVGVAWNGRMWVAVGSDSTQSNTIKYSYDGITWLNSSGSGFTSSGFGIAYSIQIQPDIATQNLNIFSQNQPNYLYSTNQITAYSSSISINDTMYVNRVTDSVGIRTANPQYPLDVNGQVWARSTLLVGSSVNDNQIRFYGTTLDGAGSFNHTVISERIYESTESSELLLFKANDIADRVRVLAGSFQVDVGGLSSWSQGGSLPTATYISSIYVSGVNGNVGIKRGNPGVALDVTGEIRASDNITAYSDVRYKENIFRIENALSSVKEMRGVFYNPIGQSTSRVGVIAQEMEKVLPEVVCTDTTENANKSVAYGNITAILIEAVKELSAKVDALSKH